MAKASGGFLARIASLLGRSVYEPGPPTYAPQIDDRPIEEARRALGGNIQQIPVTQLRWYLRDLEQAQAQADAGFLSRPGQLYRAMARDGYLSGLLSTRTAGLVGLPKQFFGRNLEIVNALRANNGSRSVFDEMCPPSELAALSADGDVMGVGVAELVPVEGRTYPVLVRLDPEFLQYVWPESRWYYVSRVGRLPITPGDGRWVLYVRGGRIAPWRWGLWPALGRAFISKEHALSNRQGFIAGIANPGRFIEAPQGATESERRRFFSHLVNWGPNTVIEVPAGWSVKILEVIGRAWETFQKEIDTSDLNYMIAIAGQIVTVTGGAGFQNSEIHKVIRKDLIKDDADNLAYCVNTQVLPQWIVNHYGWEALEDGTSIAWNYEEPKDREAESRTQTNVAGAIKSLSEALAPYKLELDVQEFVTRYGIPLKGEGERAYAGLNEAPRAQPVAKPRLELVEDTTEEAAA